MVTPCQARRYWPIVTSISLARRTFDNNEVDGDATLDMEMLFSHYKHLIGVLSLPYQEDRW